MLLQERKNEILNSIYSSDDNDEEGMQEDAKHEQVLCHFWSLLDERQPCLRNLKNLTDPAVIDPKYTI